MSSTDRTQTDKPDPVGAHHTPAAARIEISAFDNRWNVAAVRMVVENEKLPSQREITQVILPLAGRHMDQADVLSTMQWNQLALDRQSRKPR